MGTYKAKPDGGQGGKIGHSNMSHHDKTEFIKEQAKKGRRAQSKEKIKEGLKEANGWSSYTR